MYSGQIEKPLITAIDDENSNLVLLEFVIGEAGFGFFGIQHSSEAIDILLKNRPKLILLDINMPVLNGYELCKLLKSDQNLQDIPVIFLTGKDQVEDKVMGLELGGTDYITKPFNKSELIARLKTHMDLLEAKEKMKKQALYLEKDNRFKDRLFSIIGHDLRAPLSALKMQLDFTLNGLIDPKSDSFIDTTIPNMAATTDEALGLLNNLLEWARTEKGMTKIITEEVVIRELIEECIRIQKMSINFKNIKLDVSLPDHEIKCLVDMNKVKTVLRNLLSNAVKFTPRNGSIMISAKEHRGKVRIIIKDSGVGISPENIKKILDPSKHFTQIGTENESGTGLGLMLCIDFIRRHNSELNIESEVDKGSVFSFDLPLI